MGRWLVASLSLVGLMSLASVPAVHADLVKDVERYNGTITDVGVIRGPLQIGGVEYRIRGEVISLVDIDLSDATFTIEEFFVELDGPVGPGAGELMRKSQGPDDGPASDPLLVPCGPSEPNCPLIQTQGDPDEARFSVGGFRPDIRVKVSKDEDDGGFKYRFEIRLDRGMMRGRPLYCPGEHTSYALTEDDDGRFRTTIRNSFTIAEQGNPENEIAVIATKKWECPQPGRYHLRSR